MAGLDVEGITKVLDNVRCRTAAESLVELGLDVCRDEKLDPRRFWVVVATKAMDMAGITKEYHQQHGLGKRNAITPMDEQECRRFGSERILFGQHEGKRYDEIPLSYLAWLSEQKRRDLEILRYFESRRVQSEVESE